MKNGVWISNTDSSTKTEDFKGLGGESECQAEGLSLSLRANLMGICCMGLEGCYSISIPKLEVPLQVT